MSISDIMMVVTMIFFAFLIVIFLYFFGVFNFMKPSIKTGGMITNQTQNYITKSMNVTLYYENFTFTNATYGQILTIPGSSSIFGQPIYLSVYEVSTGVIQIYVMYRSTQHIINAEQLSNNVYSFESVVPIGNVTVSLSGYIVTESLSNTIFNMSVTMSFYSRSF